MQHFFVDQDISESHLTLTDEEILHQMKNVLRVRVGEEFIFLDNKGGKTKGVTESIDKKTIVFKLSEYKNYPYPNRHIRLYIAISKKPATFELILQKATELGVTDIIPLNTSRCQIKEIHNLRRLNFIIKEASEQCERIFLPIFHEVISFDKFATSPPNGIILTGDGRFYDKKLSEIKIEKDENVNLVIGPEGGLTDEELKAIKDSGGTIFILGENILRMETAAISALSLIVF